MDALEELSLSSPEWPESFQDLPTDLLNGTLMNVDDVEQTVMDLLLPNADEITETTTTTLPTASSMPPISTGQPTVAGPTSIAFDIKKTEVGPNGEITTTTKSIKFQVGSAQSSMVASGKLIGTKQRKGTGVSKRGGARGGGIPRTSNYRPTVTTSNFPSLSLGSGLASPMSASAPTYLTTTASFPATFIATPTSSPSTSTTIPMSTAKPITLNLNPMTAAAAAAAMVANPGNFLALNDIRKREIDKFIENITMGAKLKAAAQAAVAAAAANSGANAPGVGSSSAPFIQRAPDGTVKLKLVS